ncbi:MAG: PTS sugar transporter subunit IIA [Anaeromyxobacteraceae bacterium]
MKIVEFLRPDAIIATLGGTSAQAVLAELSRPLCGSHKLDPQRLLDTLLDREKLGSTGIGEGVAIPHGKVAGLPALIASFGRSPQGIDFRAIDGKPTHLFFTLVAPENSAGAHLKALARISRIFKNPSFREAIMKASTSDEIFRLIEAEDGRY